MTSSMQDAPLSGTPVPTSARLYYGWVMLPLSMLAIMATSAGQTYGISGFNAGIGTSLKLTETELAKAYMLGTILGAIPIAYFGYLMDRFGLRKTVLVAITLFSMACFLMAATTSWFLLVISFCLLRMLGPGTLAMLSGNMMAFWFHRRLGSIEAIRKLSLSVAMGTVPILNHWMLERFGWRNSYFIWGTGIWIGLFPLFYFLYRNRPEDVGQSLDSRRAPQEDDPKEVLTGMPFAEVVRTSAFWALSTGSGVFALVMTAIVFNRISIMEQQGLDGIESAYMISALSATWAVTQFLSGNLVDRFPPKPFLILGQILFCLSVLALRGANSSSAVLLTGVLMGAGQGFYSGASHPVWPRYFGKLHLGKITGIWMAAMVAASATGPYFAGVVRDVTGSFSSSLLIFAIFPIPVAILTLFSDFGPTPGRRPISNGLA